MTDREIRDQLVRDNQDQRWRRYITALSANYTPQGVLIVLLADIELATEMSAERVEWAESLSGQIAT